MGLSGHRMLCIPFGGHLLLLHYPRDYGCGHDVSGNPKVSHMLKDVTNADAAAG